jgi:Leucine-rich repeat (LRR) protein
MVAANTLRRLSVHLRVALLLGCSFCSVFFSLCDAVVVNPLPNAQLDALQDLYLATNGVSWLWRPVESSNAVEWNFKTVLGETPNPCSPIWQGLNCSSECSSTNRSVYKYCTLTALELPRYNLSGTLPASIGNLTGLTILDLSSNRLHGTLPLTIGYLTRLLTLAVGALVSPSADARELLKLEAAGKLNVSKYYKGTSDSLSELATNHRKLLNEYDMNRRTLYRTDSLFDAGYDLHNEIEFESTYNNSNVLANYSFENKLNGTIPSEIGLMKGLRTLSLSSNRFSGSIPPALYTLTNLTYLDLDFNIVYSTISRQVANLVNLQTFSVYSNQIYGEIPTEFGLLTELVFLGLSVNAMNGSIPTEFGLLAKLGSLGVEMNELVGTIPSQLGQLTNLQLLATGFNPITGPLPTELGNLHHLRALNVQDSYLTGPFPSALCSISTMQVMFLDVNLLSGSICDNFDNLTSIGLMAGVYNLFTGTLPESVFAPPHLINVDWGFNMFTGAIPESLGSMSFLGNCSNSSVSIAILSYFATEAAVVTTASYVSLSENMLSHTIPSTLSRLSCLSYFLAYHNLLEGRIPTDIGLMSAMTALVLDSNSLEGPIPTSVTKLSFLKQLTINDNRLTGSLPVNLTTLSNLESLTADTNYLTGRVSSDFFENMPKIETVSLFSNSLSGTIPTSLVHLFTLRSLLLADNRFTGNLDVFARTWAPRGPLSKLQSMDLSNNRLTGSLPDGIFLLPNLTSLSLVKNCFHGSIPSAVCAMPAISSLSLNGLSSGVSCQIPLIKILHTYSTTNYMSGTIPSCLFSLTTLRSLEVAGNGLRGSLPGSADYSLPSELLNISASNNRLTGTVPAAFLVGTLAVLDLSSNELSGTCEGMGSFYNNYVPRTDSIVADVATNRTLLAESPQLSLADNRLSGNLPSEFRSITTINILSGNLFGCTSKDELPMYDPHYEQAGCGTNFLEATVVVYFVAFVVVVAVVMGYMYISYSRKPTNITSSAANGCLQFIFDGAHYLWTDAKVKFRAGSVEDVQISSLDSAPVEVIRSLRIINVEASAAAPAISSNCSSSAVEKNDGASSDVSEESILSSISRVKTTFGFQESTSNNEESVAKSETTDADASAWNEIDNTIKSSMSASTKDLTVFVKSRMAEVGYAENSYCLKLFVGMRVVAVLVTLILCVIFMPIYPILKSVAAGIYSTHLFQYALNPSAAFLTGWLPALVICLLILGVSTGVFIGIGSFNAALRTSLDRVICKSQTLSWPAIHNVYYSGGTDIAIVSDLQPHNSVGRDGVSTSISRSLTHSLGRVSSSRVRSERVSSARINSARISSARISNGQFSNGRVSSARIKSIGTNPMILSIPSLVSNSSESAATTTNSRTGDGTDQALLDYYSSYLQSLLHGYSIAIRNVLFIFVDVVVISVVNGAFVYVILTQKELAVYAAEFALAFVKIGWNSSVMPFFLDRINKHKASKSAVDEEVTNSVWSKRATRLDVQAYLNVFNILVSPILCLLVDGSNCFLYTFTTNETLESSTVYKSCHVTDFTGQCVDIPQAIMSSFVPPFIYTYQCSSQFIRNYVAVFVIMFIYYALVSPLFHLGLAFVYIRCPVIDDATHSVFERVGNAMMMTATKSTNGIAKTDNHVHMFLNQRAPLVTPPATVSSTRYSLVFKYLSKRCAKVDRYVCKLIVDVTVVLTFGLAYPTLGIIVCLSSLFTTTEFMLLLSRCCQVYDHSPELRVKPFPRMNGDGIIDVLARFRYPIVILTCWFFAFFIYDMSAGEYRSGLWASIVLVAWPAVLFLSTVATERVDWSRIGRKIFGSKSTTASIAGARSVEMMSLGVESTGSDGASSSGSPSPSPLKEDLRGSGGSLDSNNSSDPNTGINGSPRVASLRVLGAEGVPSAVGNWSPAKPGSATPESRVRDTYDVEANSSFVADYSITLNPIQIRQPASQALQQLRHGPSKSSRLSTDT